MENEKRMARGKILSQITFLDADFRKAAREQAELDMEVKRLRKEKSNIEVALQDKTVRMKKLETMQSMTAAEIQKLRRKLQLIR